VDLSSLQPGLNGVAETTVVLENTARHIGSGLVAAFATPAMIALMEQSAVNAVAPHLPDGWQTVGVHVDVQHLAATPVRMKVVARAELVGVTGRRLKFQVTAHDEVELIGRGTHERAVVDLERFGARLASKS
jgi:predicted thioesterase